MAYMRQLEILIYYLEPGSEFAVPIAKTYNSWLIARPNGKDLKMHALIYHSNLSFIIKTDMNGAPLHCIGPILHIQRDPN